MTNNTANNNGNKTSQRELNSNDVHEITYGIKQHNRIQQV